MTARMHGRCNGGLQAAAGAVGVCKGLKPAVVLLLLCIVPLSAYTERTVTYHADAACTLRATICVPDTGTSHPCLMLIHEGGFTHGSRHCFAQYGEYFTDRGFATCAVDYRLVREGGAWPGALHDCIRALRWVHASADSLRIDAARIYLLGSSAGAYLAVMTSLAHAFPAGVLPDSMTVPSVAGAVSSFGLYDWGRTAWRGDGFLADGTERAASPVSYAEAARCPYLLWAGGRDRLFGTGQAGTFAAAVRAAGGTAEVRIMPKAGHQGVCDLNGPVMRWGLPALRAFLGIE